LHHSKQENKSRGFLAQLVQSIWFTPRGSGVRIPQDPQKRKRNLSKKFGFLAQLVQSIWFTPRGSGVRIPQDPQRSLKELGDFFVFMIFYPIHRLSKHFNHYFKSLILIIIFQFKGRILGVSFFSEVSFPI
jgi:hypothetical protein